MVFKYMVGNQKFSVVNFNDVQRTLIILLIYFFLDQSVIKYHPVINYNNHNNDNKNLSLLVITRVFNKVIT